MPTAAVVANFFDGSWAFNATSFWLAIAGIVIGFGGFAFTIYQTIKARNAAEAAKDAASDARDQVSKISALVDLTRLCGLSSEMVSLLGEENVEAAAFRALDLRQGIAQIRVSPAGRHLMHPEEWQLMVTQIGVLHDSLVTSSFRSSRREIAFDGLIHEMASIHEKLSELAATAIHKTGA